MARGTSDRDETSSYFGQPDDVPVCGRCRQSPTPTALRFEVLEDDSRLFVCRLCFLLAESHSVIEAVDSQALRQSRDAAVAFARVEACAEELYSACRDLDALAAQRRFALVKAIAEDLHARFVAGVIDIATEAADAGARGSQGSRSRSPRRARPRT